MEFEDSDENKLSYTPIFNDYVSEPLSQHAPQVVTGCYSELHARVWGTRVIYRSVCNLVYRFDCLFTAHYEWFRSEVVFPPPPPLMREGFVSRWTCWRSIWSSSWCRGSLASTWVPSHTFWCKAPYMVVLKIIQCDKVKIFYLLVLVYDHELTITFHLYYKALY